MPGRRRSGRSVESSRQEHRRRRRNRPVVLGPGSYLASDGERDASTYFRARLDVRLDRIRRGEGIVAARRPRQLRNGKIDVWRTMRRWCESIGREGHDAVASLYPINVQSIGLKLLPKRGLKVRY